jgi:Skp family chaperone for outer membrane proteins
MKRSVKLRFTFVLAALAGLLALAGLGAKDAEPKKEPAKADASKGEAADPATPVKPKPLSDNVKKGLSYLVNQQHDDGGWGQGGGWRIGDKGNGRVEGAGIKDPPDVANTCIATLALLRAGNTPKQGEYAKNVAKGIEFICANIEKSDKDSLYVTDVRGSQVQSKIGPFVDTFLSTLVLAELKGKCDENTEKRLVAALNKTVAKIEKHQKEDGTFAGNHGWATSLSQALCSKGLNRAVQNGAMVSDQAIQRDNKNSVAGLDKKSGEFKAAAPTAPAAGPATTARATPAAGAGGASAPSDAGVAIYSVSGKTAGLQEKYNSLKAQEQKNKDVLQSKSATKQQKERAQVQLDQLKDVQEAQTAATRGLVNQVNDARFVAGFGSNGGEEFLSYMNISETLLVKGGADWAKWDKSVTDNLNRIQDKDGGWSGHHCITGRTFCTASALLVLLADRAPIPVAVKGQEKK